MKKIVFIILVFGVLLFGNTVNADVMPYYTSAISEYTIGFLKVPDFFRVHLYPRIDSPIQDIVSLQRYQVKIDKGVLDPIDVYSVQLDNELAYCMVIDEQNGWYKVVYDKQNNISGWVLPENENDFLRLRDFYSFYGKKNGLYYMKNIDYRKEGLYSGAYDKSQKIDGFSMIKSIKLHKISGNWALVTVIDLTEKPKIGYIRWRQDNGSLLLFPKIR